MMYGAIALVVIGFHPACRLVDKTRYSRWDNTLQPTLHRHTDLYSHEYINAHSNGNDYGNTDDNSDSHTLGTF